MNRPILSVGGLKVAYGATPVIHDIAFDLHAGEALALVGLSGCGKTTILRALLGMLPPSAKVAGELTTRHGTIDLGNRKALRTRLGREIGFVAQNPFDACAPLRHVRRHIEEAWRALGLHPDPRRIAALCKGLDLDPAMLDRYPHEWSGGMLQRANIAAAVALAPPVLLADEPTSALDADNANAALACLRDQGRALLLVSHDLDLVARTADRVILIENGTRTAATSGACIANATAPRPFAVFAQICTVMRPSPPDSTQPLLQVNDLELARGGRQIVSKASFSLCPGEVLGIAGPSGSGKSTLLAALAGWLPPAAGTILRDGAERPPYPREVLPLYQDALASMNPRWPVLRIVAEPLTVERCTSRAHNMEAATTALHELGLGHINPHVRPSALSMGQSQRVTLARARLVRPRLILADEPTSALDPRQMAAALNGLAHLVSLGCATVLVSHDEALLASFCHKVMKLDSGRLVAAATAAGAVRTFQ